MAPFLKRMGDMSTPSIALSCGTSAPASLRRVGMRSRVEDNWRDGEGRRQKRLEEGKEAKNNSEAVPRNS